MGEGGDGTDRDRLFVSHAAEDTELAGALSQLVVAAFDLRRSDVFVSSRSGQRIQPGQPWGGPLLAEMRRTDLAIALVTPAYLASTYCAIELGAFWALGTPIVPVLVSVGRAVEIPAPLAAFEYVEPGEDAPDRIVEAIRRHRPDAAVFPHRPEGTRFLTLVEPPATPGEWTAGRAEPGPIGSRSVGAVASPGDLTVVLPVTGGLSILRGRWEEQALTLRRLPLPTPGSETRVVGVGTYAGVGPHVEVFVATGNERIDHVVDAGRGWGTWRTMAQPPPARLVELHPVSSEPGTFTLYALDDRHRIWRQHWAGGDGDWDGWEEIEPPRTDPTLPPHLILHLAVTSSRPGGEDLLATDLTGGIWVGWRAAGPIEWHPIGRMDGPRTLAATSRLRGHLELFVVDRAGVIHHAWRNPDENGLPPLAVMTHQPPVPVVGLAACAAEDGSEGLVALDDLGGMAIRHLVRDRWGPWSRIAVARTTPQG